MTGITGSGSYGARGISGALRSDNVEIGVLGGTVDFNGANLDGVASLGLLTEQYAELSPSDETFRILKTFGFANQTVTSTPFTLAEGDPPLVLVDTDTIGGAAVVNLPASGSGGFWVVQVRGSGGTVTIDANGTEVINGALTLVLAAEDDAALLVNTKESANHWIAFTTP